MSMWVVPGAPLLDGAGWRIWYCWPATDDFQRPAPVTVTLAGIEQQTREEWALLAAIPGVNRRAGILTVGLPQPSPGARYTVVVPEAQRPQGFRWRTLPDRVDRELPDRPGMTGVSFLFSSCFWWNNDKEGSYSGRVLDLARIWQPAFKMMLGDQVYQDWPWSLDIGDGPNERYADRYEQYWGDEKYRELMQSTPTFFMGDDHEFWNDYPEKQMQFAHTWTEAGRNKFGQAAHDLYDLYQRRANGTADVWATFSIEPVSFFISDSRSERSPIGAAAPRFFSGAQWKALQDWVYNLKGPGVLTIGQPMFTHPGGRKDHTLLDFADDYARLVALFDRSMRGENAERRPHDILELSGDIHIGRHVVGRMSGIAPFNETHELIASAASRIAPDIRTPHPSAPPSKVAVLSGDRTLRWAVEMSESPTMPTIENNVGLVHMSTGTATPDGTPRTRFRLELWRVRPYDTRHLLGRLLHERKPSETGALVRIHAAEVQLR